MKRIIAVTLISWLPVLILTAIGYYLYDRPVAAFMASLDGPVVTFFQIITYLGVSTWYLVISACLALYFHFISPKIRLVRQLSYFFCAIAVSGLVTNGIKWVMGRWRPRLYLSEGLYGFGFFGQGYDQTSFPSGHATTICSLAVALYFIWPRFRWLWVTVALLVCVSRVVIGAHYPSDVLMGAYVGIFVAILLRKLPQFGKDMTGAEST